MGVYGGRTPHYRIPFMLFGDIIDPDDERRISRTVDNQLYGAIRAHSGGNGIIRIGTTTLVQDAGDGTYTAVLDDSTADPSLEAFINQIYVAQNDAVRWIHLENGTTYYLFARLVETTEVSSRESAEFSTYASTESTPPGDGVLVMTVTVNEPGASTFDRAPPQQLIVPDLGAHIADNQNPHGESLQQTHLVVSGVDILESLRLVDLRIDQLTVSGDSTFSGLLEIFGDLVVLGDIIISGDVEFLDAFINTATVLSGTYGYLGVTSGMEVYGPSYFGQDVTMSGFTTVDGRDISADGAALDAHVADVSNPHEVTASQIGAISISGGGPVTGNILLADGVTIDGIDPSADLPILFSGVNVDYLHTHSPASLVPATRSVGRAPRYCDSVESGIHDGVMGIVVDDSHNAYQWSPEQDSGQRAVVTQQYVPSDMLNINELLLTSRLDTVAPGNQLDVVILDTDGNAVSLTGATGIQNAAYTQDTIVASGGQFTPGEFFTIRTELMAISGMSAYLAEQVLIYNTVSGL